MQKIRKIFAFLGFMGVVLGAFGAHYLRAKVSAENLLIWHTATFYLFVHVIMGLLTSFLTQKIRGSVFFACGIVFFSGSLYLLALTNIRLVGAITPVGGVLFLIGWLLLIVDF